MQKQTHCIAFLSAIILGSGLIYPTYLVSKTVASYECHANCTFKCVPNNDCDFAFTRKSCTSTCNVTFDTNIIAKNMNRVCDICKKLPPTSDSCLISRHRYGDSYTIEPTCFPVAIVSALFFPLMMLLSITFGYLIAVAYLVFVSQFRNDIEANRNRISLGAFMFVSGTHNHIGENSPVQILDQFTIRNIVKLSS